MRILLSLIYQAQAASSAQCKNALLIAWLQKRYIKLLHDRTARADHDLQDMYLYHFLLRYPGRTLVFLSSIDGIRRLHPLFSLLGLGEIGMLHSGMQQKARLKALDRYVHLHAGSLRY